MIIFNFVKHLHLSSALSSEGLDSFPTPGTRGSGVLFRNLAGNAAERKTERKSPARPRVSDFDYFQSGVEATKEKNFPAAASFFRKTLEINPEHLEALVNLIVVLEKTNQIEEAENLARDAAKSNRDDPLLHIVSAKLARRSKNYAAAFAHLRANGNKPLPRNMAVMQHYELGLLYDLSGDYDNAFASFGKANRLAKPADESKKKNLDRRIETLSSLMDGGWQRTWETSRRATRGRSPVFLVGFPRSGTTLLSTILGTHPEVVALDEPPTLSIVKNRISSLPGGYPHALPKLSDASIADLRNLYYRSVSTIEPAHGGRLIVDKQPLNIVHLPLIHRIFPDAVYLFVLRHPCDVCLSCFMHQFESNPATDHFHDLAETVAFYKSILSLGDKFVQGFPLHVHAIRYEDLVEHREAEITRLLKALGLDWDDGLRGFHSNAGYIGKVLTPSYSQVSEPLYTRARYRWTNYERYLRPFLGEMDGIIRRQGY